MTQHRGTSRTEGRRNRMALAAIATAMALVLSACSGGGSDNSAGGSTSSETITAAMKPVATLDMPTEAFTQPTGKRVLILECGNSAQGCVREAKEQKELAESLGWTADVVDGKLDPTVWNQVVKQAAENGVDGIIAGSADPNLYADAMQVVADKDIPFVLTNQTPADKDVPGIDTYIAPDPKVGGAAVADWIKADSGGKANVLIMNAPGYADLVERASVIADTLKKDCSGCKVEKADINSATIASTLAPLITNRLQTNPKIDYIWGTEDCCVSFMQQGIRQAGKTDSVKLASMTGYADQMTQIKTGEMAAELATPATYTSWLAVDSLGRLMAGLPAKKFWPLPQRIWSAANIKDAPATVFKTGWNTEADYETAFKSLWGTDK